ncbi:MAG: hypothetical protein HY852_21260 [Bradyrhizobium sp.]|uniref:hypothetical protein n=1 Tax=Bradyrhizobium sp. TaxID=376 RepID=UPI0025C646A6|nr:hypothetical protein [Bradyrhizobium sp.]MBI5264336.1 hypothetical protein [Bradyrhizobium sp.]
MRHTISGLVAALAVMIAGAAPAMACGWGGCSPCGTVYGSPCAAPAYVPAYTYAGCASGCGYYERLVDPATQYYPTRQYYYVNQGPTYTGPGAFAPYPVYQENAIPVYPRHHRYSHRWHGHHHHYGPVLRRYY